MVRHIVMWNHKAGADAPQKARNALAIKEKLEALAAVIPGIVSISVAVETLEGSGRDVVLNSLFEDENALAAYQTHPAHVAVSQFVRTLMVDRVCVDFNES